MLVRSLRSIVSVLILNATGGNIRFGLWVSSTFSDARNWPKTDRHLRAGKSAKRTRAEPIAACFERGEAKFAGRFPQLEDELAGLTMGGDYLGPGRSPDRADACVWALTELLLGPKREPGIRRL